MTKCDQRLEGDARCVEDGAFRYTWPGRDEAVICRTHIGKLLAVAEAMGMHLQVIPL